MLREMLSPLLLLLLTPKPSLTCWTSSSPLDRWIVDVYSPASLPTCRLHCNHTRIFRGQKDPLDAYMYHHRAHLPKPRKQKKLRHPPALLARIQPPSPSFSGTRPSPRAARRTG